NGIKFLLNLCEQVFKRIGELKETESIEEFGNMARVLMCPLIVSHWDQQVSKQPDSGKVQSSHACNKKEINSNNQRQVTSESFRLQLRTICPNSWQFVKENFVFLPIGFIYDTNLYIDKVNFDCMEEKLFNQAISEILRKYPEIQFINVQGQKAR